MTVVALVIIHCGNDIKINVIMNKLELLYAMQSIVTVVLHFMDYSHTKIKAKLIL